MVPYDRLTVYNKMLATGLIPLFYHDDAAVARAAAQAVSEGGAAVLEFTNRGPRALPVFSELSQYIQEEELPLILGIGSVVDASTAALFVANGARFVVGPVLNLEVAHFCNRRKIAYIPGCSGASEISEAEMLGAEIVKVFPGSTLGGPRFIKSILGPMPWSRLMPTGGVDASEENIRAWIDAGAACVGMGSQLIRKDLLAQGDYAAISEKVRQVLGFIREARGAGA